MTLSPPEEITNEEILLRQINPAFIQDGRISSSVFEPTKKDEGNLSCSVLSKIEPKDSFLTYTKVKKYKSVGIAKIKTGDVSEVGLRSFYSPNTDGPSPDADIFDQAHGHIEFGTTISNSSKKDKAKKLASIARDNGVLFFDETGNQI